MKMNEQDIINKDLTAKEYFDLLRYRDEVIIFEDEPSTYWEALRFQAVNLQIENQKKRDVLTIINKRETTWYKATNTRKTYNIL